MDDPAWITESPFSKREALEDYRTLLLGGWEPTVRLLSERWYWKKTTAQDFITRCKRGGLLVEKAPEKKRRKARTETDTLAAPMLPGLEGTIEDGVRTKPDTPKEKISDKKFEALREIYPHRIGGHNWGGAKGAYNARLREGYTHEIIEAGLRRYIAFVNDTEKEGTEYVKMAKSFFGKDRCFLDEWKSRPPRKKSGMSVGRL